MSARTPARYRSLDLWRGVACLSVTLYHATQYFVRDFASSAHALDRLLARALDDLGGPGIYLFFVISGYCITANAESLRRRDGAARSFLYRRVRRIFPPYWAFLAFAAALFLLLPSLFYVDEIHLSVGPRGLTWAQWIGTLTLSEEWSWLLLGGHKQWMIVHAWSLCIEEQFYLTIAFILIVARRHFYIAITILTLILAPSLELIRIEWPRWYLPIAGVAYSGYWPLFACGILVYYLLQRGTKVRRALLLAAMASVSLACWIDFATTRRHAPLAVATLFALLLTLLHRHDAAIDQSRLLRPIRFLGRMCYSLYLLHLPIVMATSRFLDGRGVRGTVAVLFVIVPISVAASVSAAWLFHCVIERRFLNPPVAPSRNAIPPSVAAVTA